MSLFAIAGFVLLGAICLGLRYQSRQEAQIARENTDWELTYTTKFTAQTGPGREEARVQLAIPRDTPYCEVLNANDVNRIIANSKPAIRPPRSISLDGKSSSVSDNSPVGRVRRQCDVSPATEPATQRFASTPVGKLGAGRGAGSCRMCRASFQSTQKRFNRSFKLFWATPRRTLRSCDRIFSFCQQIDDKSDSADDDVDGALTNGVGTPLARARTMVTLSRAEDVPARLVAGFRIAQGTNVKPHVWTEAFIEQAWIPYDPSDGWSLTLPPTYVPVRCSGGQQQDELADDQIVEYRNTVGQPTTVFSIRVMDRDASLLQGEVRHLTQI